MRNRKGLYKGFLVLVWSGAILIMACCLVQSGIVIGDDHKDKDKNHNFIQGVVGDMGIYLIEKNIPIAEYTSQKRQSGNVTNPIVHFLMKFSPISMYVVANGNVDSEVQVIKENEAQKKAIASEEMEGEIDIESLPAGSIGYIFGETYSEEFHEPVDVAEAMAINRNKIEILKKSQDISYLLKNFYTVDSTTSVDRSVFQVKALLNKDLSIEKNKDKPQILIYHTHATTEGFIDSRPGKKEDTVVGVGGYLAQLLTEVYGYQVIHDETEYDKMNGITDRNKAYNYSLKGVENTLKKYPTIKVIIDLHRDGVSQKVRRTVSVNDKKSAQVMFFNGLSRNQAGNIAYLRNPNLQNNLAFSLQLKLKAMEKYPSFTKPNYLKGYRYNLQLCARSLLIELGNQNNTVEDAKNAMEPLADILNQVLSESPP